MKPEKDSSFWTSYTDLMTSLFFVMLVLYILTYLQLTKTIKAQKKELEIINTVNKTLEPLKKDTTLFKYEKDYQRFELSFDVKFKRNKFNISETDLDNYQATIAKINDAGLSLKKVLDSIYDKKNPEGTRYNSLMKNVSYVMVIAGYASNSGLELDNYILSYKRALSLWEYWRDYDNIDFEAPQFISNNIVDLQIAGNGWGGVGRDTKVETNNQRFLISLFPKIGDLDRVN
ncbi:MAG: hypothetical protein QM528_05150 [Phycisphaerales bacterium]|nr:hypothetical protein [Phycisphaerales bacterium]